jgi:large conductance mechanosensitive channel
MSKLQRAAARIPVGQARSFLEEFRTFAARGNVVDLAVGVIIGAAFGKIVNSLVTQVVMPPIGLLIGQVDFEKLEWVLKPAAPGKPGSQVSIQYGAFLDTVIQFLIVAFVVFLMVRAINLLRDSQAKAPDSAAPPAPTPTEALLAEIRDELKAGRSQPERARSR